MTDKTPLQRACDLVGGQSELARVLVKLKPDRSLTPQAVQYWCRKDRVPANWVIAIESATDSQITRYELRPDLYPRSTAAA